MGKGLKEHVTTEDDPPVEFDTFSCRKLYSAIITRAILDMFGIYDQVDQLRWSASIHIEARNWLFGLNHDQEGRCEYYCDELGLDYDKLKRNLVALEKRKAEILGDAVELEDRSDRLRAALRIPAKRIRSSSWGYWG